MIRNEDIRKELVDIYGISDIIIPPRHAVNAVRAEQTAKADTWEAIELDLQGCVKCRLAESRTNLVLGEGNRNAELMFIGEGPGEQEDETGRPFVGKAGQLLTKMIKAMGFEREEVFIANVVKCRPPDNRQPFNNEMEACMGFLRRQIALIKPKIIVALGGTAATGLLNSPQRITHIRGKFQNYNGAKLMPTFHPAYLLRNESAKKEVWNDLKAVMAELGKPLPGQKT